MRLFVKETNMLNRTPPNKPTDTANVISSYRKRRMQRGPILFYGAIGLVVIGLIVIVIWLFQPDQPIGAMFATETPTPTLTLTPTNTSTPTATATITETPTLTLTATPSEPFDYIIQEGDTLPALAERFNLGDDGVLLIFDNNPQIAESGGVYFVGQTLRIPPPGTVRATATPIPADLPRGRLVEYSVLPGDTLAGIAAKFNSRAEDIITANDIENANALNVGDVLQIPVNLVTATATLPSTSTPVTPTIEGQPTLAPATNTSIPGTSGPTTCSGTTNEAFVVEMQTLINDERAKTSLPALTISERLVTSARNYATDMLCKNYFSPIGLDGSTAKSRAAGQGYSASVIFENIYALHPAYGISPQVAFNWWMKNPEYSANILNPTVTEMGVIYVSDENTLFGAYFVATFAKP
jgi:uncharacterized protein YkwD